MIVDFPRRPPIRYLGFPWQAARWLFTARERIVPQDTSIKLMSYARSILGALIVLFLTYGLRVAETDSEPSAATWLRLYLYIPIAMVGMWPIMLGLVLAAEPQYRRETLRQLRWPVLSMLGLVAAGVTVVLVTLLLGLLVAWLEKTGGVPEALLMEQVVAVTICCWLWLLIFAGVATVLFKTPFRADDGHPYLSPLLSILTAWAVVLIDLVIPEDVVSYSGLWQHLVGYGAAITVTGLALWQITRLRTIYGITFRTGPWPQWWPAGAGPATAPPPAPPPLPGPLAHTIATIGYVLLFFATISAVLAIVSAVVAALALALGAPLEILRTILKPFVWLGLFLLAAWYVLRYTRQRSTVRVRTIRELIARGRWRYQEWRLRRRGLYL